MSSGNDAAYALAEAGGGREATLAAMNQLAADLGATTPSRRTRPGWTRPARRQRLRPGPDRPGRVGAQGLPRLRHDPAGRLPRSGRPEDEEARDLHDQNHNKLLYNYDGTIGIKNGYTDAANRTFISAVTRGGRTYLLSEMYGLDSRGGPGGDVRLGVRLRRPGRVGRRARRARHGHLAAHAAAHQPRRPPSSPRRGPRPVLRPRRPPPAPVAAPRARHWPLDPGWSPRPASRCWCCCSRSWSSAAVPSARMRPGTADALAASARQRTAMAQSSTLDADSAAPRVDDGRRPMSRGPSGGAAGPVCRVRSCRARPHRRRRARRRRRRWCGRPPAGRRSAAPHRAPRGRVRGPRARVLGELVAPGRRWTGAARGVEAWPPRRPDEDDPRHEVEPDEQPDDERRNRG